MLSFFFIFGLVSNGLVILGKFYWSSLINTNLLVTSYHRRNMSASTIFVSHLAIADFLILLHLPITIGEIFKLIDF